MTVAIAALALGMWLGGHPSSLPGPLRDAFVSSDVSVRTQLINDVKDQYYKPVTQKQLEQASLKGIVASLQDPYSQYLSPAETQRFTQELSGQFEGVGMNVDRRASGRQGLYVSRVFQGSPAQKAGITAGSFIVAVNGKSIAGTNPDQATALIRGPAGTRVTLTFKAKGAKRSRTVSVERQKLNIPLVDGRIFTRAGKKLGYVSLLEFDAGASDQLRKQVEQELRAGARGIVLDLRGNPGGEIDEAQAVAGIFLPKGKLVVSTRGRAVPEHRYLANGDPIPASVPVVVLVDGGSASASEIVTGALNDWARATIVGTRTFGKGVFQTTEPLDNNGLLKLTIGSYYLPKGENIQGHGIVATVKAQDNPKTPPDEARDAALRTLAAKIP